MQGMMQPRLQRVMNAADNVFLFDVDRRPFCPHFRRSLSVAVATTRARFWLNVTTIGAHRSFRPI